MKTFHQQNLHSSKKAGDCKSAGIDEDRQPQGVAISSSVKC